MQINIMGFEQSKLVEMNLNGNDLIVLRKMVDIIESDRFFKKDIEGSEFTWIKYSLLVEDLPFITDKEDTMKKIVAKLIKNDLLDRVVLKSIGNGSYTYFRVTNKLMDMLYKQDSEVRAGEDKIEPKKNKVEDLKEKENYIEEGIELRTELEVIQSVMTDRMSYKTASLLLNNLSNVNLNSLYNSLKKNRDNGNFVNNSYVRTAIEIEINKNNTKILKQSVVF